VFGDVGGVLEVFRIAFSCIASSFSLKRLASILTNAVFIVSAQAQEMVLKQAEFRGSELKANYLERSVTGEIQTQVVDTLSIKIIMQEVCRYFCCRCRKNAFSRHVKLTELGLKRFEEELDLVRLTRRMRMHGILLSFLTNQTEKKLSASLCYHRLRVSDRTGSRKMSWQAIENFDLMDRFHFSFAHKF